MFNSKKIKALETIVSQQSKELQELRQFIPVKWSPMDVFLQNSADEISQLKTRVSDLSKLRVHFVELEDRIKAIEHYNKKEILEIRDLFLPILEAYSKIIFEQVEEEENEGSNEAEVKRHMCKHCKIPMAKNGKTKRGIRFRCRKCWEFKYV